MMSGRPKAKEGTKDAAATSGYHRAPDSQSALVADLWFFWEGDLPTLEIQLVTVEGTIAGAYPKTVAKGERLPIHRKYLRPGAATTWYVRVVGAADGVSGLSIALELTDRRDRVRTLAICESEGVRPQRIAQIERVLMLPETLDPAS
jgi:hypothetical protein